MAATCANWASETWHLSSSAPCSFFQDVLSSFVLISNPAPQFSGKAWMSLSVFIPVCAVLWVSVLPAFTHSRGSSTLQTRTNPLWHKSQEIFHWVGWWTVLAVESGPWSHLILPAKFYDVSSPRELNVCLVDLDLAGMYQGPEDPSIASSCWTH